MPQSSKQERYLLLVQLNIYMHDEFRINKFRSLSFFVNLTTFDRELVARQSNKLITNY